MGPAESDAALKADRQDGKLGGWPLRPRLARAWFRCGATGSLTLGCDSRPAVLHAGQGEAWSSPEEDGRSKQGHIFRAEPFVGSAAALQHRVVLSAPPHPFPVMSLSLSLLVSTIALLFLLGGRQM